MKPCPQHISNTDGSLQAQSFIMFVDDNLMADSPNCIKKCMAASLEALFRTMGFDAPTIRRSNDIIEKYFQLTVSHYQTQLGLDVDTWRMVVTLPDSKRKPLTALLKHWHHHRKSFVIKEANFFARQAESRC